MTNVDPSQRVRHVVGRACLLGLLTVAACSSEDQRPLLYVNAPFSAYAATAQALQITVTIDGQPAFAQTIGASTNSFGTFGLYLPSGKSGNASVVIRILDANNCVIATGAGGPIPVAAGQPAGPITVVFGEPDIPCLIDGGAIDTSPAPTDGPAPADAVAGEAPAFPDSAPTADGLVDSLDGARPEASPDALPLPDAGTDAADASRLPDAPADVPGPDQRVVPDAVPDTAPTTPDATPMGIFRNCSKTTHTLTTSSGDPMEFGVYKVLFTPDGKMVITMGEDGRAKVWDVTETGLKENASKLVFAGNGLLRGAISGDGKYLAIGEVRGRVVVYDLPASLNAGAAVAKWTLPATSPEPYSANPRHFTKDGNHLVVVYSGDSDPDPNRLVVWDLTTQTIVRTVDYVYDDFPYAVLPGDFAGPMWAASAMERKTDAGLENVVTLSDVAQAGATKVQVVVPETVEHLAFSPDGKWLLIGFDTGQVDMWDVSDKTKMVKPAAPLYEEGTGWLVGVYATAFTSDSAYLAVATETGEQFVVRMASLRDHVSLEYATTFAAMSLAFAPDDLALVIGLHSDSGGLVLYCKP